MSTPGRKPPSRRNRHLSRIHCLKRDLGLDDDAYRDLVWSIGRRRSAGELDDHGRMILIKTMQVQLDARRRANGARSSSYPGRPHNTGHNRQLKKIEAQLADAGRPWAYADKLCRQMTDKDRLAFCDSDDLRKIIAALAVDARRREAAQ